MTNFVSSDHVNDYCALPESAAKELANTDSKQQPQTPSKDHLWMCYGGGAGFGGYGGYGGYHRRIRFFEIDTNTARIISWKRLEYGDIESKINEQTLVNGGRVVAPSGGK